MRKIVLLIFFSAQTLIVNSQILTDRYDSHFRETNNCNWGWLTWSMGGEFAKDTITKWNELPASKLSYNATKGGFGLFANFTKRIQLPLGEYKDLSVSLVYKRPYGKKLSLEVSSIDGLENVLNNQRTQIEISSDWQTATVRVNAKGVKAAMVRISYEGGSNTDQPLWLSGITIRLDGKDINTMGAAYTPPMGRAALVPSHIIPLLSGNNFYIQDGVMDISNAKIIGLGENTHGSKSLRAARFQFVKKFVTDYSCKLIVVEAPVAVGLLMERYIQGQAPAEWPELEEYLKFGFGDYRQEKAFLTWLRQYNVSASRKVHIYGIDHSGPISGPALMEFYYTLLGASQSIPYLKLLSYERIQDVCELSKRDTILKSSLGEKIFDALQCLLKGQGNGGLNESRLNRDQIMYTRLLLLDSIFTKPGDKTIVLAHSEHLKKIEENGFNGKNEVLGSLLSKRFGNGYHSIGFCFGSGTFLQDSCSMQLEQGYVVDSIRYFPPDSFEYAARQTGVDYFYYASSFLSPFIESIANITRFSRGANPFMFAALKRRFDGYVFIGKSIPSEYFENKPAVNKLKFLTDQRSKFIRIVYDSTSSHR